MEGVINLQQILAGAIAAYPLPYRSNREPNTLWTLREIYAGKLVLCSEPLKGYPQMHPEYSLSKQEVLERSRGAQPVPEVACLVTR